MSKAPLYTNGSPKLVIVPDSCSLLRMATPVPEEFFKPGFKGKRPENFSDILLDFLPKKRVQRVHLLDIIGGESFGRFANGDYYRSSLQVSEHESDKTACALGDRIYDPKNDFVHVIETKQGRPLLQVFAAIEKIQEELNTCFDKLPANADTATRFEHMGGAMRDIAAFARQVDKYLEILPDSDAKTEKKATLDKHLQQLSGAIHHFCKTPDETNLGKQKRVAEDLLRKIKKLLRNNRGEQIIKDYVLEHPTPTYFISDDKKGREQVKAASQDNSHGCIYVDNTVGFFTTLKDAGLLKKCGFNDWVTPEMIVLEMSRYGANSVVANALMSRDFTAIAGSETKTGNPKPVENWFR